MKTMKNLKFRSAGIITSLIISVILISCEKYDRDIEGNINVFLLDEYKTADNSSRILSDDIVLSDEPLFYYSDLLEYNANEYAFKLTPAASEKLGDLYGSAFAVTLGKEIIYTGYFWSGFSSQSVDWLIVEILRAEVDSELVVQLGYPGILEGWTIPDSRNDKRILSVFARDNKLID
jgi:hypothetical protein